MTDRTTPVGVSGRKSALWSRKHARDLTRNCREAGTVGDSFATHERSAVKLWPGSQKHIDQA
jgi:hypothetical protein